MILFALACWRSPTDTLVSAESGARSAGSTLRIRVWVFTEMCRCVWAQMGASVFVLVLNLH